MRVCNCAECIEFESKLASLRSRYAHPDDQDSRLLREAYQQRAWARPSAADSQLDELRAALAGLVAYIYRTGGYMSPEDQAALWRARVAMAENKP